MGDPTRDNVPYGTIRDRFDARRVIPFVGAGVCMVGREEKWTLGRGLPLGSELARELARDLGYSGEHRFCERCGEPIGDGDLRLDKIAQHAKNAENEFVFRTRLRSILAEQGRPNDLHDLLAELWPRIRLVVTTNYDTLLESALHSRDERFHTVFHTPRNQAGANCFGFLEHGGERPQYFSDDQLARRDLSEAGIIFKMHGTMATGAARDWEDFVITEDDYTAFLSQMPIPTAFFPYFVESSFLFLGCSLEDPDVRVLLHQLRKHRSKQDVPSWSIRRGASNAEKSAWAKRGVTVCNEVLTDFVRQIREELGRIGSV